MLFMVMVIMGYQIWTTSKQPQGPQITAEQHYASLVKMNEERKDVSIVQENSAYGNAIDDLVKQKKMTQAEADVKKVDSAILVADTQLKAAIHANDPGRLRDAYATLQPLEKEYLDKPIWNTAVPVADVTKDKIYERTWTTWTGQALYTNVVDRLTAANQHELVYGFIPGYQFMDALVRLSGAVSWYSYALAAFLLAFVVRAIVFPISQKQLMHFRQMGQLAPVIKEIKDQFSGKDGTTKTEDAAEIQKRTMKVYQEYGINPFQGCLPALIQFPLFITVYQCMIRYQFAFQKGTFLWINKATSLRTHGFIAPNLGQADYILIIIYGITMMSSTLLTPASDPSQVKQQRLMSVGMSLMFTLFMFTGKFPVVSGFVLYWVFTNLLSTAQSLRAYRLPLPPLVKVNAAGGGVYPKPSKFAQWMEKAQQMQEQSNKNGGPPANSASAKWLPKEPEAPKELPNGSPSPRATTKRVEDDQEAEAALKHKPKKRK
jgi:YidC/Oxa1 family membrane protein insertase